MSSVYEKLSEARNKFHSLQLKKTGHNKFTGFYYFELSDFLVPALEVLREFKLISVVSFSSEYATLTIVDIENPTERVQFQSPMGHAALKGAHEVQNIGAVETYQRRYLYITAFEVVEHDALDQSMGKPDNNAPIVQKAKSAAAITADSMKFSDEDSDAIAIIANEIHGAWSDSQYQTMMDLYGLIEDNDIKIGVWAKLPSHVRSQIKKLGKPSKEQS